MAAIFRRYKLEVVREDDPEKWGDFARKRGTVRTPGFFGREEDSRCSRDPDLIFQYGYQWLKLDANVIGLVFSSIRCTF
jgi:hypothetical protein